MQRFMGMMPSKEIERTVHFKDSHGLKISIDAGPHGWTINYADGGNKYKDVDSTTDANFNEALAEATKDLGELTQLDNFESKNVEAGED